MQTLYISLHLAEQHGVAEVTHRLGRREAHRATAAAQHTRQRCRGDEGGPRRAAPRRLRTDESCQRAHRLHRRGLARARALRVRVEVGVRVWDGAAHRRRSACGRRLGLILDRLLQVLPRLARAHRAAHRRSGAPHRRGRAPRRRGTGDARARTLAAVVGGAEAKVGRTQQRARGAQRGVDDGGGRGGNCGSGDGGGDADRLGGVAQSEVEQAEQPRRRCTPDRRQPHRYCIVGERSAQHPRDAHCARRRSERGGGGHGLRVSCECIDRGLALRLVEALERAPAQRGKNSGAGLGRAGRWGLGAGGWELRAKEPIRRLGAALPGSYCLPPPAAVACGAVPRSRPQRAPPAAPPRAARAPRATRRAPPAPVASRRYPPALLPSSCGTVLTMAPSPPLAPLAPPLPPCP
eukprot:scaffold19250_cov58-Phaeocystis_antarctica.AAC.1